MLFIEVSLKIVSLLFLDQQFEKWVGGLAVYFNTSLSNIIKRHIFIEKTCLKQTFLYLKKSFNNIFLGRGTFLRMAKTNQSNNCISNNVFRWR